LQDQYYERNTQVKIRKPSWTGIKNVRPLATKKGRVICGVAAVVVIFGSGHDSGVADQAKKQPTPTVATPAPTMYVDKEWSEDAWPTDLLLWAGCNSAPRCDIRTVGTIEGHKHCVAAINETTLIMCPDGFRQTS
jgi:hypothetical protein